MIVESVNVATVTPKDHHHGGCTQVPGKVVGHCAQSHDSRDHYMATAGLSHGQKVTTAVHIAPDRNQHTKMPTSTCIGHTLDNNNVQIPHHIVRAGNMLPNVSVDALADAHTLLSFTEQAMALAGGTQYNSEVSSLGSVRSQDAMQTASTGRYNEQKFYNYMNSAYMDVEMADPAAHVNVPGDLIANRAYTRSQATHHGHAKADNQVHCCPGRKMEIDLRNILLRHSPYQAANGSQHSTLLRHLVKHEPYPQHTNHEQFNQLLEHIHSKVCILFNG